MRRNNDDIRDTGAAAAVARRQSCVDNDVSKAVIDRRLMDAGFLKLSSTVVDCALY